MKSVHKFLIIWEQIKRRKMWENPHKPCTAHTQRLQYEYSTHADTRDHAEGRQQEEQWGLCALSTDERDDVCVKLWPQIPFCLLHIWSIHCYNSHTSLIRWWVCVYTTYPQCTAAAAHSTPQWTPRWPAHCHQVALWQWCDENCPLVPRKRKKTQTTHITAMRSSKTCLLFSSLLLRFLPCCHNYLYMLKYASLKLGLMLINSPVAAVCGYNYANKAN